MNKQDQSEIITLENTQNPDVSFRRKVVDPEEVQVKMPLFYLKFFMDSVKQKDADIIKILKEHLVLFRKDFYDLTYSELEEYLPKYENQKDVGKKYLQNYGIEELVQISKYSSENIKTEGMVGFESPLYRLYPYKFMFAYLIQNCTYQDYYNKIELFTNLVDNDSDGIITEEELIKGFTFYNHEDQQVVSPEIVRLLVKKILNFSKSEDKGKISTIEFKDFLTNIDTAIQSTAISDLANKEYVESLVYDKPQPAYKFLVVRALFWAALISGSGFYAIAFFSTTSDINLLVAITKLFANLIKFYLMLLLLINTKTFKILLQKLGRLISFFNFEFIADLHSFLGILVIVFAFVHSVLHYSGTYLAIAYARDLTEMNKLLNLPMDSQPSYWELAFASVPSVTGLVMSAFLLTLALYSFRFFRKKDFEGFWFTHMLWPIIIILGCFHGIKSMLAPVEFWKWIIVPLLIYFAEYVTKAALVISNEYEILEMRDLGKQLYKLDVQVPDSFIKEGALAIQLNFPKYSPYQWHFFYVFPSERENCISLYISQEGSWTQELKSHITTIEAPYNFPKVNLYGPYPTYNSIEYRSYGELVFVANDQYLAAFLPIIAKVLKVYQHTTITIIWFHQKEYKESWISRLLSIIKKYDETNTRTNIYLHLLSPNDSFDLRYYLIWKSMEFLNQTEKKNYSGLYSGISWGIPNWYKLLERVFISTKAPEIGVFCHCDDWIYNKLKKESTIFRGRAIFTIIRKHFDKSNAITI